MLRSMRGLFLSTQPGTFHHEPLDHTQPSIRLIEITPGLSARGLVRCNILHTTIESRYTCLSYRWGDEDPSTSRTILLNGRSFTVRQNLYDFLYLACTEPRWSKVTQRKYWIDALCINQSDSSERNHQVAQMGQIFTNARRVHAWLGRTSDVRRVSNLLSSRSSDSEDGMRGEPLKLQRNMELIGRYVLHNQYWSRAWVIQEMVLARRVIVSLNTITLRLSKFSDRIRRLHVDISQTPFEQFIVGGSRDLRAIVSNQSLLFLLHWFRDKDCSVSHDRVFALLAICHQADRLGVDYDIHWTDLTVHVLGNPRHQLCVCSAALVARSLVTNPVKPRSGDRTCICRPMLAFDGRYVELGRSGFLDLVDLDFIAESPSCLQRACLRRLVYALNVVWIRCRVGIYMREKHQELQSEMPFIRAMHEAMKLEHIQILWQRVANDGPYYWYGECAGWNILICDKDPEFCRVRIAFDELQAVFPTTALCDRSSSGRSEASDLFTIEWGQVMEPV